MAKFTSLLIAIVLVFAQCNSKKQPAELTGQEEPASEKPAAPRVSLTKAWTTPEDLTTCESTLYYPEEDIIFVSNINGKPQEKDGNGFISKLSTDGNIIELKWVDGLNAPKGMAIQNGKLYVSDISELVQIDLATATVTGRYTIEGASFLNDVAINNEGKVFVTGSDMGGIYTVEDDALVTWLEHEDFKRPNGLYAIEDTLFVAFAGDGIFRAVHMGTKEMTKLAEGLGRSDGIAPDGKGNFFVSSWSGAVFFIPEGQQPIEILNTEQQGLNSADIDYMKDEQLLLVPTFQGNTVEAYKVTYK
jgi:sugar lactone lactonase YvrE